MKDYEITRSEIAGNYKYVPEYSIVKRRTCMSLIIRNIIDCLNFIPYGDERDI